MTRRPIWMTFRPWKPPLHDQQIGRFLFFKETQIAEELAVQRPDARVNDLYFLPPLLVLQFYPVIRSGIVLRVEEIFEIEFTFFNGNARIFKHLHHNPLSKSLVRIHHQYS